MNYIISMPAPQFKAAARRLRENVPNRSILETLSQGFASLVNLKLEKGSGVQPIQFAPSLKTPSYMVGFKKAREVLLKLNKYVREGIIPASKVGGKRLF